MNSDKSNQVSLRKHSQECPKVPQSQPTKARGTEGSYINIYKKVNYARSKERANKSRKEARTDNLQEIFVELSREN